MGRQMRQQRQTKLLLIADDGDAQHDRGYNTPLIDTQFAQRAGLGEALAQVGINILFQDGANLGWIGHG